MSVRDTTKNKKKTIKILTLHVSVYTWRTVKKSH